MAASLTAYLQRTVDLPWEWGRVDCTMWAADWCVQRWGIDPAAPFRDRYSTEAEMLALTADGLLPLIAPRMAFAQPVTEPQEGDVGVTEADGKQVAAIRVGGQWALRAPHGIVMADLPTLAAWGD